MRGAPGDAEDARIQTQSRARGHLQTTTVSGSRARHKRQVGQSVVEFAVIFPVFLLLLYSRKLRHRNWIFHKLFVSEGCTGRRLKSATAPQL